MRIRLDLAYDGTDFAGWQNQPDRDSVQGIVEETLRRLYRLDPGERLAVTGAGRTDAGVHAEQQVAHFDAPHPIPPDGIRDALNGFLPDAVRVMAAAEVAADFHARYHAVSKTYRYQILTSVRPSPLRSRFAWANGYELNREPMEEAAGAFVGRHDFRAFFAAHPGEEPESPYRTVTTARWLDDGDSPEDTLTFEVAADGFLRYMVRRMVGTLAAVGRGQLPPERVGEMLREPDAPGPRFRAPAAGLRLHRIRYPDRYETVPPSADPDGSEPPETPSEAPKTPPPGC